MLFSMEDKHTIKVLRKQKLYGATKILIMFPIKNWTLSGVKTGLSKRLTLPAASNVLRVAVGRARLAVLIR